MKIFKVRVSVGSPDGDQSVEFGFNKMSDALIFASTCVETVDGMEDSEAMISIFTKEEN